MSTIGADACAASRPRRPPGAGGRRRHRPRHRLGAAALLDQAAQADGRRVLDALFGSQFAAGRVVAQRPPDTGERRRGELRRGAAVRRVAGGVRAGAAVPACWSAAGRARPGGGPVTASRRPASASAGRSRRSPEPTGTLDWLAGPDLVRQSILADPRHRAGRAGHAPRLRLRPAALPHGAEHAVDPRRDRPRGGGGAADVGAAHLARPRSTCSPPTTRAVVLVVDRATRMCATSSAGRAPGAVHAPGGWADDDDPAAPVLDDRSYEQLREELIAAHRRLRARVDRPRAERPGHHAARAGRLPRREPALPVQPDPRPDQAVAAAPAPGERRGRPAPATGLVAFTPTTPDAPTPPAVELGTSVTAGAVPFRVGNDVTVLPLTATAVVKAAARACRPTRCCADEAAARARRRRARRRTRHRCCSPRVVLAPDPAAPGFEPLDVATAVDHIALDRRARRAQATPATLAALLARRRRCWQPRRCCSASSASAVPDDGGGRPVRRARPAARAARRVAAIADACAGSAPRAEPPGGVAQVVDSTLHLAGVVVGADREGEPDWLSGRRRARHHRRTAPRRRRGAAAAGDAAADWSAPPVDDPDLAGVGDRPPALRRRPGAVLAAGVPPAGRSRDRPAALGRAQRGRRRAGGGGRARAPRARHRHAPPGAGARRSDTVVGSSVTRRGRGAGPVDAWDGGGLASRRAGAATAMCCSTRRAACCAAATASVAGCSASATGSGRSTYRYGGGAARNVPAGAISKAADQRRRRRRQPGADWRAARTPSRSAAALDRIPGELARHDRAVTGRRLPRAGARSRASAGRSACPASTPRPRAPRRRAW